MSLDSDPLDLAFPAEPQTAAPASGDPLDLAFPKETAAALAEPPKKPSLVDKYLGFQESQLSGATGGVASLAGGLSYLGRKAEGLVGLSGGSEADAQKERADVQEALTYKPRTAEGKRQTAAMGQAAQYLGPKEAAYLGPRAADLATRLGASPEGAGVAGAAGEVVGNVLPQAAVGAGLGALGRVRPAGPPIPTAEEIVGNTAAQQSGGAAGTAADLSKVPAELKQAIVQASQKTGGAVNPEALKAHLEAAEHGIQLMKGQATQNQDQFTAEQNSTHPDITARINAQEHQIVDALDNVRRDASPTNVANSPRENGQVALDDLKAYGAPKVQAVTNAYDAANEANIAAGKGALKLDPQPGIDHAASVLEDKEDLLPSEGQNILKKMQDAASSGQGITVKQAETWKTIVARAGRKYDRAGDTNATAALSDFRDSLEQMTPSNAAAPVQALYTKARGLSKALHDEREADPAFDAAMDDTSKPGTPSPLADTFLDDYALNRGAPKSQVDLMLGKLSPEGQGAVASHTLSAIRKGAVNSSGKVLPSGYNTAMAKYSDKLDSLVSPETQDSLESLGRTITRAKVEPAGGKTNYSRSGVVARDAIQHAAEGLANAKTGGIYGVVKKMLPDQFAKEALKPGAGLDELATKP